MQTGIRFKATPAPAQKETLSQWMGCARVVWNAKCDESRYYSAFARKYHPVGTFAPVDKTYSQFKSNELTPWLKNCPSQILRNSVTTWCNTYQRFMKGECGKPQRKPKADRGSIYLTNELFRFEPQDNGEYRLFIGSKRNNIGYLSFKAHRAFGLPNSLHIIRECGQYFVSFSYEDGLPAAANDEDNLAWLKQAEPEWLEQHVTGVDRGVAVAAHTDQVPFHFSPEQQRAMVRKKLRIKRHQRCLARQVKGSNRRNRTKQKIGLLHRDVANIRKDFLHKTSHALVNSDARVIVFEALKTSQMTRKAKPKQDEHGRFIKNGAKAKSGLNREILAIGWHRLETFTRYKAQRAGKATFKINPAHTSQECAECRHIHPENRETQAVFKCILCGHTDNADRNAGRVAKRRAIELILHPGTGLQGKGMPTLVLNEGAKRKTGCGNAVSAAGVDRVKIDRAAA